MSKSETGNRSNQPPIEGISYLLPNGTWATMTPSDDPKTRQAIQALFWQSWSGQNRRGKNSLKNNIQKEGK